MRYPERPGSPRARSRLLSAALLATVLASVVATTSCAQVLDQVRGAEVDGGGRPVDTRQVLETVDWGVLDGIVSVLVQNPTDRTLRRADAVITVRGEDGELLGSSDAATFEGRCCTALNVPPGARVGFYVVLGEDAADVADVDVAYEDTSWAPSGATGGPMASARPGRLVDNAQGTLALATVETSGGPIGNALVQAVVDGPDGDFLAVISGEWYCFRPGETRDIRMQLYERVPVGSTVEEVNVFPISEPPLGGDANVGASCAGQPRTGPGTGALGRPPGSGT